LPESRVIDKIRFFPAVFFVSGSAKILNLSNKWSTQRIAAGASNITLQAPAVVQISIITLNAYFSLLVSQIILPQLITTAQTDNLAYN
jgi:hypothetical protein